MRRTRFAFVLSISCMRSNCRFTRGLFFRRWWLFMPLACISLPVAVILNRRLALLLVFSFNLAILVRFLSLRRDRPLAHGRHVDDHRPAFHSRRLFDGAMVAQLLDQLLE